MKRLVEDNSDRLYQAYHTDLGKPVGDWFFERQAIYADIEHVRACVAAAAGGGMSRMTCT